MSGQETDASTTPLAGRAAVVADGTGGIVTVVDELSFGGDVAIMHEGFGQ